MATQILDLSGIPSITKPISNEDLAALCRQNPDLRLETDAQGKLIIMSPTGSETGDLEEIRFAVRNGELFLQVGIWNKQFKLGKVFDSSTGFRLANGAVRSPDVSWVKLETWNSLSKELRQGFAPIDPDFVIELLSPSDDIKLTREKMQEYKSCGVKLGWLIDPGTKQVEIYRQGREKEILTNPQTLSGEVILPQLVVDLTEIFA